MIFAKMRSLPYPLVSLVEMSSKLKNLTLTEIWPIVHPDVVLSPYFSPLCRFSTMMNLRRRPWKTQQPVVMVVNSKISKKRNKIKCQKDSLWFFFFDTVTHQTKIYPVRASQKPIIEVSHFWNQLKVCFKMESVS